MKTRYLIICLEMCFQVFSKIFFFFASSAERQVMADFQGVTYMKLEDDSIFLSLSKSKLYFLKTLLVPKCFLKGFFAQSKKFLKWNINHLWGKKKKISSYVSVFSQIWISLQLNSFKCFKQVCLTSPRGGYSMETNG